MSRSAAPVVVTAQAIRQRLLCSGGAYGRCQPAGEPREVVGAAIPVSVWRANAGGAAGEAGLRLQAGRRQGAGEEDEKRPMILETNMICVVFLSCFRSFVSCEGVKSFTSWRFGPSNMKVMLR